MCADFSPRRGRPSAEQVAAIDQAILKVARRIFLEQGYDALAMDAVAAELRVSKGTLYNRHPSKEALLQAVIVDAIEKLSDRAAREDHLLSDEIGERLRQRMRGVGRATADPEIAAYYRLWTSIQYRIPGAARLFYDIGYRRGVRGIADDLRRFGERDGCPPRDAEAAAAQLMSTLIGWYMQESAVREVPLDEIDGFADRIVEFFMLARAAW